MTGSPNPRISEVATFIAKTLNDFVAPSGGEAVIVPDSRELWEQAARNTESLVVWVYFAGETPFSSNANLAAVTQRVSRKWQVFVQRGIGYGSNRADSMAGTSASGPQAFFTLLDGIRDTIRAMIGISQDDGIDQVVIKPVQIGRVNDGMVAYMIEFSTKNNLQNFNSLKKTQL